MNTPLAEPERTPEPRFERRRHRIDARDFEREHGLPEGWRYPLWVLLFAGLAIVFVIAIAGSHYLLDQAVHRIWKVLLGVSLCSVFIVRPDWTLFALPLVFSYAEWLPKAPIPMVNTFNVINYVTLFTWLGRAAIQRRPLFESTPLNAPIGLFLAWSFLEFVQGSIRGGAVTSPLRGFQIYSTNFMGFILFFPFLQVIREWRQVRRLSVWFSVTAALGLFSMIVESQGYGGNRRVGGAIGDINVAGAYFAYCALFTVGMTRAPGQSMLSRFTLIVSTAAQLAGMLFSGSRGAMVALVAGGLPQALRTGVVGLVLTSVLLGGAIVAAPAMVKDRFVELFHAVDHDSGAGDLAAVDDSAGGRLEIWKAVLRITAANPIFGVGLGQLPTQVNEQLGRYKVAHNLYLDVLGEMGIPGFCLLVYLLATAMRTARRVSRRSGYAGILGGSVYFALIGLLFANLFGQRFFHFSMNGAFSLLMALVVRADQLSAAEEMQALTTGAPPGEGGECASST